MRTYSVTPAITRLMAKISRDEVTGCWIYTGGINSRGYGVVWGDGRSLVAHRVSYEHHVGPIPEGMHLDHLCRVRSCVAPTHLEPVTPRENLMRSPIAPAALNAAKTHCRNGHLFDEANTTIWSGERICRTCARDKAQRYRTRRADA